MQPLVPTHSKRLFGLVAVLLFALTFWLHLWRLNSTPAGLFVDEASNAYNAYCIAKTGADEYGARWPVFFRCLDDYRDAPFIYAEAPVVGLYGLHPWAARLPSALFQILTAIVFGFLVQQFCRNRWLALGAGFIFSIIPWLFPTSRIAAAGHTALVFGLTLGCLLALYALNRKSIGCALGVGLSFAFSMYAYSIGRPMTVLILFCFALAFAGTLCRRWKLMLTFLAAFALALVPMMLAVRDAPNVLGARFKDIWIAQPGGPTGQAMLANACARYPEYFDPRFLFLKGDANLRQNSGFAGELFFFLIPLILVGLYCLIRFARRRRDYRFVGLALLAYPVAASLTPDKWHSIRAIDGALFWVLTAAIGARFLWRKPGWPRRLLLVICCAGAVESTWYLADYFQNYPTRSRGWYNANLTELLQDGFQRLPRGATLYISPSVFGPQGGILDDDFKPFLYVDLLFFGEIEPQLYQSRGLPHERVRMYRGELAGPGLLLRCNRRMLQPQETLHGQTYNVFRGAHEYVMNDEPVPGGARLLTTRPITKEMGYEIYEVR